MILQDWKQFCRKAWESDYDFSKIGSFAEIGERRYTIGNCNETTYKECTPDTTIF